MTIEEDVLELQADVLALQTAATRAAGGGASQGAAVPEGYSGRATCITTANENDLTVGQVYVVTQDANQADHCWVTNNFGKLVVRPRAEFTVVL